MIYAFADHEVDPTRFELRRRGIPVPLEPQVFEVLSYLVQHHDRFVTKDELIEHVWPERYISESALNNRLMAARRAIGDNGKEQRLIRTVHGRGFRFLGTVRQMDETAATADQPHQHDGVAPAPEALRERSAPTALSVHGVQGRATSLGEAIASPGRTSVGGNPAHAYRHTAPAAMLESAVRAPFRSVLCPDLVGRAAEVGTLRRLIEGVSVSGGTTALLAGEAGIGKSRLVAEARSYAASGGFLVLEGACFPQDHASPYAPLLDLLRSRFAGLPAKAIAAAVGPFAREIALLLPEIGLPLDAAQPATSDPVLERRRLFAALSHCLTLPAQDQPVLVILEDLHSHENDYGERASCNWGVAPGGTGSVGASVTV